LDAGAELVLAWICFATAAFESFVFFIVTPWQSDHSFGEFHVLNYILVLGFLCRRIRFFRVAVLCAIHEESYLATKRPSQSRFLFQKQMAKEIPSILTLKLGIAAVMLTGLHVTLAEWFGWVKPLRCQLRRFRRSSRFASQIATGLFA